MINNYDISCIIEPIKKRGGPFQGSIITATNINALNYYNITSVLSICSKFKIQYASEINNLILDCHDTPHFDMTTLFEQAHNYLESSRQYSKVLVHCHEGISRSTAIVVSYMMKKRNLNLEQAFIYVIYQRPIVSLNQALSNNSFQMSKIFMVELLHFQMNQSLLIFITKINKTNITFQYYLKTKNILINLRNNSDQKSNPLILPLDLSLLVSQSSCNLHLNKQTQQINNQYPQFTTPQISKNSNGKTFAYQQPIFIPFTVPISKEIISAFKTNSEQQKVKQQYFYFQIDNNNTQTII